MTEDFLAFLLATFLSGAAGGFVGVFVGINLRDRMTDDADS